MRKISKRILLDEAQHPIAVQIDYQDWLDIEKELGLPPDDERLSDLSQLAGSISLSEDPVEYQKRIRREWP